MAKKTLAGLESEITYLKKVLVRTKQEVFQLLKAHDKSSHCADISVREIVKQTAAGDFTKSDLIDYCFDTTSALDDFNREVESKFALVSAIIDNALNDKVQA